MSKKIKITPASVIIGVIGAVLISASSFYTVLKFGALPWPTVMVTLISIMALNFFKKTDSKEITVTHTIMSAGSMVAGGVAFTMPGYLILGGKLENINKTLLFVTILLGSVLGCVLSFIFRKKMIEEENLEFPIGEAAYNLVNSDNTKKDGLFVGLGVLFSTVVSVLRDINFTKGKSPIIPTLISTKNGFLSFYVSPLLVGIGYILGFLNTFIWFLGGALVHFIAQPLAISKNIKDFDLMKNSFGMGIVVGIGFGVIVKLIFSQLKKEKKSTSIFSKKLFTYFLITVLLITFIYKLPIILAFVLLVICILCTIIAGYSTGKTGVNPMEIYAIITILIISFLGKLKFLNFAFSTKFSTLLLFFLACIVAVACGLAGDILNDFKSGYKTKTNPKEQFLGELIGAVVSSVVITWLFFVFFNIYKNIGPKENSELIVLQASIVASIINGIPFIQFFFTGLLIGFALYMLNFPVLTFGIGIYVPFYLTLPVFLGGLLNLIFGKISTKFSQKFMMFSNGLMSGEAIIGVIISLIAYYFILFR